LSVSSEAAPPGAIDCAGKTDAIRTNAKELLTSGQVGCVIGYEVGPRGRTRPVFVYDSSEADKLVWNPDCTHDLVVYLQDRLKVVNGKEPPKPVGVVVKPCDSRAINVLLAENQFARQQVYVIGLVCDGIVSRRQSSNEESGKQFYQNRCLTCTERVPVVYDTLIGEPSPLLVTHHSSPVMEDIGNLQNATPAERLEYWLGQFDRCIRCYACRQACPMCNCPICLYERDDSLWVGLGIGVNEKRTFHLGRAYHLAGRCVGCDECERACPMDIPISLLNQRLVQEVEQAFGHRAGMSAAPSPIVTALSGDNIVHAVNTGGTPVQDGREG
jgi:ferredoxin